MKHSLVWMMTALTLMASNALAYNNPHILEVDLSIEGVNDSQEFWEPDPPEGAGIPKGPGGFVCSNGFKKITLRAEGVNPPMRMRLNWDSAKIAVCATTNDAGTPGSSEIYWDIQSPWTTQLWVKGVAVSDTGPTKDASGAWMSCGPEHLCLEAINNATPYVTPLYDRIAFTVLKVEIDDGATPSVILRGDDAKIKFSIEPATFTPMEIHLKVFDGTEQVFQDLSVPVSATEAIWDGIVYRGINDYATEDEYEAKIRVFYGSGSGDYCEDTVAIKVSELSPVWLEFTDDQPLKDNDGNDIRHADGAHWKRAFGTATANAGDVKHASYKFAGTCKADIEFSAGIGSTTHNLSEATDVEIYADGSPEDFGSASSAESATFQNWPSAKVGFESTSMDDEIHYYEDLASGLFQDNFVFDWRYRVKDSAGNWSDWIWMKNYRSLHYMCLQRADIQAFSLYEQIVKWGCDWAEGEENDEEDITEKLFDKSISDSGLKYAGPNPSSLGEYLDQGNGMCGWTSIYLRYLNLVQGVDSKSVFFGPWAVDNWKYIVCPGQGLGGTDGWGLNANWSYFVHDNINNPEWAFQTDTGDIDYDHPNTVWYFVTKPNDGHVINWYDTQLFDLPFTKRVNMFAQPNGDQNYTPSDDFRDDYFDDGIKWLARENAPCHDAGGARNEDMCLQSSEIPTIRINFEDISCGFNQ